MKKSAAVLSTALLALTAACGGSGGSGGADGSSDPTGAGTSSESGGSDSSAETTAKASIKDSILSQGGDFGGTTVSESQAGCLANGLVDGIGIDKLKEYKLLDAQNEIQQGANPSDLDATDADSLAGTFVDCVDVVSMLTDQLTANNPLSASATKCVAKALDDETIKSVLSANFQGKQPKMNTKMQNDLTTCLMSDVGGMEMPGGTGN